MTTKSRRKLLMKKPTQKRTNPGNNVMTLGGMPRLEMKTLVQTYGSLRHVRTAKRNFVDSKLLMPCSQSMDLLMNVMHVRARRPAAPFKADIPNLVARGSKIC